MGRMRSLIRAVTGAAALVLAAAAPAGAETIKVAVGGFACVCYLPSLLAQELGFYKDEGLDVELSDFKGGSQALAAVIGGSADVVSGFYDHTINMAAKGKQLTAFAVQAKLPGLVLAVAPKATDVKSIADLAGKNVGISAPGSSTDYFIKYLLKKNGIDPAKVPVIAFGSGATSIAGMEQGNVSAGVLVEPAVTELQNRNKELRLLADTRTEEGTLAVFGGDYPASTIYARTEWLQAHGAEAQKLATAMVKTLQWIKTHSAEEVMAKAPKTLTGGDPATYLAALKHMLPTLSTTGLMDPKAAATVAAFYAEFVPEVKAANVDVAKTFTNAYVEKAMAALGVKD